MQIVTESEYDTWVKKNGPAQEVPACLEQASMQQLGLPCSDSEMGLAGLPSQGERDRDRDRKRRSTVFDDKTLEELRRRLNTADLAPHLRRRRGSFLKHAQSSGLMLNVRGFRKSGDDDGEIDLDLFAATNITANLSG